MVASYVERLPFFLFGYYKTLSIIKLLYLKGIFITI